MKKIMKSESGFTLVELLITVAIIGVLATIGVPSFKMMVQKAKKSEAKVALGGLYTAETAFFAEYGVYGSMLDKLGFDMEGASTGRTYNVGFLLANCTVSAAATIPVITNPAGIALNLAYPGYYLGLNNNGYATNKNVGPGGCAVSVITETDFKAGAAGLIAAGPTAVTDIWTMDRFRNLTLVQDGMAK